MYLLICKYMCTPTFTPLDLTLVLVCTCECMCTNKQHMYMYTYKAKNKLIFLNTNVGVANIGGGIEQQLLIVIGFMYMRSKWRGD